MLKKAGSCIQILLHAVALGCISNNGINQGGVAHHRINRHAIYARGIRYTVPFLGGTAG